MIGITLSLTWYGPWCGASTGAPDATPGATPGAAPDATPDARRDLEPRIQIPCAMHARASVRLGHMRVHRRLGRTTFPQRPAEATGRGRAGARLPGRRTYMLRDSHGPQSGSCLRATPLSATGAGRWVPPSVSPCASACRCLPQLRLQTRSSRAPGAHAACGWQVQRYCQRPLAQRSTATSHRAHLAGRMLVRGRESALRCACLDLTDT